MAQLAIKLLGSFQVNLDGNSVTKFESNKVRALLAYLAVESGTAHSREKLTDLFWPNMRRAEPIQISVVLYITCVGKSMTTRPSQFIYYAHEILCSSIQKAITG